MDGQKHINLQFPSALGNLGVPCQLIVHRPFWCGGFGVTLYLLGGNMQAGVAVGDKKQSVCIASALVKHTGRQAYMHTGIHTYI